MGHRADTAFLRDLLRRRSGLVFAEDRSYLLESRLAPVAHGLGYWSVAAMLQELRHRPDEAAFVAIAEAMSTNETSFFRDGWPFEQLVGAILPKLRAARATARHVRFWSAATSTGQEAYSLAICLAEAASGFEGWTVEILASDFSSAVLRQARDGVYSAFEVQRGLSRDRLERWFSPAGTSWRVKPEIARRVLFQTHNLLDDPRHLGVFDIVFLRNVLIYFDPPTKRHVLGHVRRVLAPDGLLVLGSTETVLGITHDFELMAGARGLYRPVLSAPGPASVAHRPDGRRAVDEKATLRRSGCAASGWR
jgi:chemotaxis protein methyltransferase CheR